MIMVIAMEIDIRFNPIFKEANRCCLRYRLLKGSAGSGKSCNVAMDFLLRLSDPLYQGANLLVVRKLDSSNRDSTFAELCAAADRIFGPQREDIWQICHHPLSLRCKLTGNSIIFRGMNGRAQREKVKSITFEKGKLCWIWVEEATELLPEDIDILDDRLRGRLDNDFLYYQITMTFNPVSAAHWLKARYFDRQQADVFTHHSHYLDNRFIDPAYHRRMERRALEDPEGYRVYGLGQWGESGGLILPHALVHEFDYGAEDFDAFYYGQDFGFNHANVLLAVGMKDGELFVARELYCRGKDTAELMELAESGGWCKLVEMFCDSAEPDRIRTWKKAGWRAVPVHKGAGSVKAQIDWLKGRALHIHADCVNTAREAQNWRWKKDLTSGLYLDEPVEGGDDAMAALRYAVERLRKGGGGMQVFK
jgi:phage terminase large subunit